MEKEDNNSDRRKFLRLGLLAGGAAIAGTVIGKTMLAEPADSGKKVKVLTADGKLVEVDSSHIKLNHLAEAKMSSVNIREGVKGKKFVMVIDLGRCANARKCVEGCQSMHNMLAPVEWIKVKRMQDTPLTAPYWFPQPCYQCDNPPCTKVCPVDATFKRTDGIVAVDNDRCIGCKFCMAACPYSARSFNWGDPKQIAHHEKHKSEEGHCHAGIPSSVGTVSKCDFCPQTAAKGELPDCVTECPNGTIFFGDENEDAVTNGEETFRLSELLRNRSGYRQYEELGTKPRVYYLPPVDRMFPFEEATEKINTKE